LATILGIFAVLVIVWCLSASRVARHPLVARALDQWGHRLSPWIFIGLGLYVLVNARAWDVLRH
jgi:cadmium resistance protein CadD (predicted permease)